MEYSIGPTVANPGIQVTADRVATLRTQFLRLQSEFWVLRGHYGNNMLIAAFGTPDWFYIDKWGLDLERVILTLEVKGIAARPQDEDKFYALESALKKLRSRFEELRAQLDHPTKTAEVLADSQIRDIGKEGITVVHPTVLSESKKESCILSKNPSTQPASISSQRVSFYDPRERNTTPPEKASTLPAKSYITPPETISTQCSFRKHPLRDLNSITGSYTDVIDSDEPRAKRQTVQGPGKGGKRNKGKPVSVVKRFPDLQNSSKADIYTFPGLIDYEAPPLNLDLRKFKLTGKIRTPVTIPPSAIASLPVQIKHVAKYRDSTGQIRYPPWVEETGAQSVTTAQKIWEQRFKGRRIKHPFAIGSSQKAVKKSIAVEVGQIRQRLSAEGKNMGV